MQNNITRLEISSTVFDPRADSLKKRLAELGLGSKIKDVWLRDVYTVDKAFSPKKIEKIVEALVNPLTQISTVRLCDPPIESGEKQSRSGQLVLTPTGLPRRVRTPRNDVGWAIEIGFLPGVTDNAAKTVREVIADALKVSFSVDEDVYSSQVLFINGKLTKKEVSLIADSLYNPLIQRAQIRHSHVDENSNEDEVLAIPKVSLQKKLQTAIVDLHVSDEELTKIGKQGIANADRTRRGPLALDLTYMKTIQAYFKKLGRNPTDIELESIAQTWSEHCKHTIFADPIDDIGKGLFKTYIKGATSAYAKAMARQRMKNICVSVFTDNSGAIVFDDEYLVTHKVETHNTPSALDPFGGAITGILGCNRDAIGFGMGALPVINTYGFCFAEPWNKTELYKGPNATQKMLSARRIMGGVIQGVNSGANCTGIPSPQGFVYFDSRFRGKPLVFVGTVGLIPRKVHGKLSHIKKAKPGDYIVMVGGRVGKDGIHGATFSSEAMDSGSPVSAVQIGDPITQKKLSDAIIKEARDLGLYNSITDNGAGGLSCSVAEMAKESGGCEVYLEKVPLKYPGLAPWEIWISESQERMTLSVSKRKWKKFKELMQRRGVEATVIGEFTDSGKCVVRLCEPRLNRGEAIPTILTRITSNEIAAYPKGTSFAEAASYAPRNDKIMDIDLAFLHDGLPERPMKSVYTQPKNEEQSIIPEKKNLTETFLDMLSRPNIASYSFISEQYDHIVQGGLALPPLQGRGKVNADVSITKPILSSKKGVMLSQALYPTYSDTDCYHMAACSIDSAIRHLVTAGADPEKIAILDNFCWCSGNDPYRLGQLKRAAEACYDYATLFQTPFISGKDSMFNDFKGFDKDGKPLAISIPPTLLISAISVIEDCTKAVSLDAKFPGDLVYLLGETYDELGASEYASMGKQELRFSSVPKVDGIRNKRLYAAFHQTITDGLIASAQSVGRGGLGVALAKTAMGGMLGLLISLHKLQGKITRNDFALFSESQGRILVTVAPENKKKFEKVLKGNAYAQIGKVTKEQKIIIRGLDDKIIVKTDVEKALEAYRATFAGF